MGAHDDFFRKLFQLRENAVDALRWMLPKELAATLDWSTLRFERASSQLERQRHADLVFSIAVRDRFLPARSPERVLIYVLFEHQRRPRRDMVLRLLEYLVHLWQRQLQAGEPITRVVPVVLYNGERPWPHPVSLTHLMPDDGLAALLGDLQVQYRFLLIDLSRLSDDEIAQAALNTHARLGLLLLKNAPRLPPETFWRHLVDWTRWLTEIWELPGGTSRLDALLHYIAHVVGDPTHENLDIIMAELPEPAAERIMTWAESLKEKGRDLGLQLGLQQGRELGLQQGRELGLQQGRQTQAQSTLRRLLERRFGPLPEPWVQRLQEASVEQLEAWTDRTLDAPTLSSVFDAPG